jgi:hypothetical protein
MLEPGRSLVGNTGLLLTSVLGVKETSKTKEGVTPRRILGSIGAASQMNTLNTFNFGEEASVQYKLCGPGKGIPLYQIKDSTVHALSSDHSLVTFVILSCNETDPLPASISSWTRQ